MKKRFTHHPSFDCSACGYSNLLLDFLECPHCHAKNYWWKNTQLTQERVNCQECKKVTDLYDMDIPWKFFYYLLRKGVTQLIEAPSQNQVGELNTLVLLHDKCKKYEKAKFRKEMGLETSDEKTH